MVVFVIFAIFLILFAFLYFNVTQSSSESADAERTPSRAYSSAVRRSTSYRSAAERQKLRANMVAQQAMQRAGYQDTEQYVRVFDIGLLAYEGDQQPKLLRFEKINTQVDYVRPFVELSLPYRSRGSVRFELVELLGSTERLRYADEAQYDLQPGTNILLPDTWFPLAGKEIKSDKWRLYIRVGDTLLAAHAFGWRRPVDDSVKQYMASDGEISPALQEALEARPNEAMSLDNLLGE